MKKLPNDGRTTKTKGFVDNHEHCTKNSFKQGHCKNGFFFALRNLPNGIFAVSLFGLFLGTSTTMVYSQFSLFLKNELGLSTADVTLLDGIVESLSFIVRAFSGPVSDFLRERKMILYAGCFITLFARSFMSIANSWWGVLLLQSSERIGNGVQATPRDALIADLSPSEFRGRAFGFSRSMKTIGSLLGTLIAMRIMLMTHDDYRVVFGYAVIPVIIAIFFLSKIRNSQEINKATSSPQQIKKKTEYPFQRRYLRSLDHTYWKILLLAFISEMAHFSEHAFPIYANQFISTALSGSSGSFISLGQVLLSFPIGFLADRYGRRRLICTCIMLMILANTFFISAPYVKQCPIVCVYAGAFLWGAQTTAVQGLFLSIICERVDVHLRATAIGIYFFMLGLAYLLASYAGGRIWDMFGSHYTFLYSMFFSSSALCVFNFLIPPSVEQHKLR
ncbi:MAG: MFS transporter [Holosporaceae bacterium]|jgi:MFS family permease|nr:MFS transporter [Holosporaceae bacterium]